MNRPQEKSEDFLHKEFPKQFRRDEFWRQIKRTVNGQPVSESDISLIVTQIVERLVLGAKDHVLDLGCGNGALASRFFDRIGSYTGVDFSDHLLAIAKEFFVPRDEIRYQASDIRVVRNYSVGNDKVDKVLIYGCLAYLSKQDVAKLLQALQEEFQNLNKIFIGNIPNRGKAQEFFAARDVESYELDDPTSPIGVWWDVDELALLSEQVGFRATCHQMPAEFYSQRYRFDMLLER